MSRLFHRNEKKDLDDKISPAEEAPPPSYPAVQATSSYFACVLLSSTDKIRLLNFPESVVAAVETAIQQGWRHGIQEQGLFKGGGYEFKLVGRPCMFNAWLILEC